MMNPDLLPATASYTKLHEDLDLFITKKIDVKQAGLQTLLLSKPNTPHVSLKLRLQSQHTTKILQCMHCCTLISLHYKSKAGGDYYVFFSDILRV